VGGVTGWRSHLPAATRWSLSEAARRRPYGPRGSPKRVVVTGTRWMATVPDSVERSSAASPWRRPSPEAFLPPIGADSALNAAVHASLMLTAPAGAGRSKRSTAREMNSS